MKRTLTITFTEAELHALSVAISLAADSNHNASSQSDMPELYADEAKAIEAADALLVRMLAVNASHRITA
jgi:hypothetical protein